jgi:hypothetical protein
MNTGYGNTVWTALLMFLLLPVMCKRENLTKEIYRFALNLAHAEPEEVIYLMTVWF